MNPTITIESSLFYAALAVITLGLSRLAEKTGKKYWVRILVLTLSFFAGFRAYSVGRDTQSYVFIFQQIINGNEITQEIGFEYFSKVILWLTSNTTVLLFVYSLIIYGCIIFRLWDLRIYASFTCSTITFFSMYYFESMNIMRQFVAMALIFYATKYIAERKYFRFSFMLLLATTFHTSALLGLGYLATEIFFWKSLNKKQKLFIGLGSMIGVMAFPLIIESTEKYSKFFRWTTIDIGLRVFALLAIWVLSFFFFRKDYNNQIYYKQDKEYLINTVKWYYLIGCLLGLVGYFYELMGRISIYYGLFTGVYFGLIVKEKKNGLLKKILVSMVVFVIVYILYNYLFTTNGSWHHPYKMILF